MVFQGSSVAISHTGKVRSNNQDSGYAGSNLFAVADGMGGHAGGDVASSLAIARLESLDQPFDSTSQAELALRHAIADAATELSETVRIRPELAGMGTTVSALVMVDEYAVIAHIGDSRIYLYRDDTLTQITTDHTFVQRLVDSGRITPEEARYHPRRSVLMRVLGDMDTDPEVDTFIMPTQPGDRWLLCSDGLSGVVDETHMAKVLAQGLPPGRTADNLLKQALDGGAPDNVTIVLVDVGGQHPVFSGTADDRRVRVHAHRDRRAGGALGTLAAGCTRCARPRTSRRTSNRRRSSSRSSSKRTAGARGGGRSAGSWASRSRCCCSRRGSRSAYQWTQTRYFVGADEDTVVIYQGIQQNLGPISLSTPYQDTGIPLDDLSEFARATVEQTIATSSLEHAQRIVASLADSAGGG